MFVDDGRWTPTDAYSVYKKRRRDEVLAYRHQVTRSRKRLRTFFIVTHPDVASGDVYTSRTTYYNQEERRFSSLLFSFTISFLILYTKRTRPERSRGENLIVFYSATKLLACPGEEKTNLWEAVHLDLDETKIYRATKIQLVGISGGTYNGTRANKFTTHT